MIKLPIYLLLVILPTGCPNQEATMTSTFSLPYNLSQPDHTIELAPNLDEISGLSLAFQETKLAAVNDEQGIIFLLNPENGSQDMSVEFHKPGDYEGIEVVGETAYVVKSSGTVYEVRNFATEGMEMTKHNDWLEKENDVEGLGYEPQTESLLLACKSKAGEGEEFAASRAIYRFDLQTNTVDSIPAYVIRLADIRQYLDTHPSLSAWEKLSEFFDPAAEDLTFAPSGLALQPSTGNLYILSSVGKLLLILDPAGEILHLEKLDKKIHRQPEGICFAADGTLYISNESKGGVAKIHRFDPQS
jgi:uncharacterized protein YjiK